MSASVILAAALLTSQGAANVAPSPLPAGRGTATVAGRVLDAAAARPLAGVHVELIEVDRWQSVTSSTDSAGRFTFSALAGGWYQVVATTPGYVVALNHGGERQALRPLVTLAGAGSVEITVDMEQAATISGRVVDSAGEPVPGAHVVAGRRRDLERSVAAEPAFVSTGGMGSSALTRGDGRFEIADMPSGDFVLRVQPPPWLQRGTARYRLTPTFYPDAPAVPDAVPLHMVPGSRLTDVEVTLPRIALYELNLRVGLPATATDAELALLQPSGQSVRNLIRGAPPASGGIRLTGVLPGRYVIAGRALVEGAPVAVAQIVDLHQDRTLLVKMDPAGRISGRVVNEGGVQLDRGAVQIVAALVVDGVEVDPRAPDRAEVSADGHFVIEGVIGVRRLRITGLPADWQLVVRQRGVERAHGVEVAAGADVTDIEVVVRPR